MDGVARHLVLEIPFYCIYTKSDFNHENNKEDVSNNNTKRKDSIVSSVCKQTMESWILNTAKTENEQEENARYISLLCILYFYMKKTSINKLRTSNNGGHNVKTAAQDQHNAL